MRLLYVWAAVLVAVLGALRPAPAAHRAQSSSASTSLTVTPAPAAVGVLTTFSPTLVRVTVGPQQCTLWARLPAPYLTIVGCYDPGSLAAAQVSATVAGHVLSGYFDLSTGTGDAIGWLVKNNADGSQTWQMSWMVGAAKQEYNGTF